MLRALLLLAPFDVLASLGMDIYLPVLTEMPRALGASPATVQLTLSLYMVTLGVGQLLFGPLSDRHGRRPVLLAGGASYALASLLLAACSQAWPFVLLRVLQALGASAMLVATFATVRDVYGGDPEAPRVYGTMGAILAWVPALAPIVGALLARAWGWRAIFLSLAIVAALSTVQAGFAWRETSPRTQASRAFRSVLGNADFWCYTLGFSAALGAFFVFFSTSPRILMERAGLPPVAFSLGFAGVAGVMMFTSRAAPTLARRWGTAGTLARAMAILLTGSLLLAALWDGEAAWTLLLPMAWTAVGIALAVAVCADGALAALGHVAGLAVALFFGVQSILVAGLGTLTIALLPGDTAWPLVVWCATAPCVVLLALATRHKLAPARS